MAGSNDSSTRKKIFSWIKTHEKTFFSPRTPITPIGVYFSPQTRNFFANEFVASYRGILILLMQKHLEFQVVTPRTLSGFRGNTLILPDVRLLSDSERSALRAYAAGSNLLAVTGEDATGIGNTANVIRFSKCPGKDYSAALQQDFDAATPDREHEFLKSLTAETSIRVLASPMLATSIASVNGQPHVFFANFAGLRGRVNPVQTPQTGVQITVSGAARGHGFFLPFLGDVQPLEGTVNAGAVRYNLPAIEKGAVFWYEP
jgi:hypothetical protein